MYVLAVAAAILITRPSLGEAQGGPPDRSGLRHRALGLPCRADRRPHLLRHHQLGRSAAAPVVGAVRDLGRRPRDLGRDRRRHRPSASGACAGPASRSPSSWTRQRRRCSSPKRSAGSATTSTRSCTAAPPRLPGASRSTPPTGPRATSSTRPSSRPSSTRSSSTSASPPSWSRSAPAPSIRPPGLFALYVTGYSAFRIFEESLRIDPAHHLLGLRLNFFVAALLPLTGALWFLWSRRDRPGADDPPVVQPGGGEQGNPRLRAPPPSGRRNLDRAFGARITQRVVEAQSRVALLSRQRSVNSTRPKRTAGKPSQREA